MNRMNDDLISRKALLEILNMRLSDYSCDTNSGAQKAANIYKHELIPVVEKVPIAFDKEKVIEELRSEIHLTVYDPMLAGRYIKKERALEIVKKGGIE